MEYQQIFEYDEWDDFDDQDDRMTIVRRPRRYIRDAQNPMEMLDDEQFRKRFRFRKDTVIEIVPIITHGHQNNRGLPVPPLIQVLVALRFYATSSYQTVCGDLFSLSQPTVHRIIKNSSENLCRQIGQFVKMPSSDADIQQTWRAFFRKARFPGVIGLIDGTQIPISSPGGETAEVFRNRKGYFSINVQIVCGPNEEIFDIVCRWPGSVHDSRIFDNSSIRVLLEENHQRLGHLLGDSGYGQKAFLFTPLLHPVTDPQKRYNAAHKTTRTAVERTIGRWKRRFPCLYFELQTKLKNTLRIIPACAILFNIGIRRMDMWEEAEEFVENADVGIHAGNNSTENNIRDAFIERHFS